MNRKMENSMGDAAEKLLEDLKQVVHDGEDILRAGAHDLSEKSVAAREKLSDAVDAAREMGIKLQKRAIAGAQSTDRVIREHPYQSLGVAFGVGILIGVLVARR